MSKFIQFHEIFLLLSIYSENVPQILREINFYSFQKNLTNFGALNFDFGKIKLKELQTLSKIKIINFQNCQKEDDYKSPKLISRKIFRFARFKF